MSGARPSDPDPNPYGPFLPPYSALFRTIAMSGSVSETGAPGFHAPVLCSRGPGPHLEQAWGSCLLQLAHSEVLWAEVPVSQQPGWPERNPSLGSRVRLRQTALENPIYLSLASVIALRFLLR